MQTICFFNNKGGVGKTTLACNFAAYLSRSCNQRVLVLDLDPQCNTTQLLLHEDMWEEIYSSENAASSQTILAPFRFILQGDSSLDTSSIPIVDAGRFQVGIVPGHPGLSTLEDIFGSSWVDFRGGQSGPTRRTIWLRALISHLESEFDVAIVDVSPSLGSINRTCLIGSDYFVTPMAPDLFSLFALDNIASWFDRWLNQYALGRPAVEDPSLTTNEQLLPSTLPISRGFLGYTVQQYVTKSRGGGEHRAVLAYDAHRAQIPARAQGLLKLTSFQRDELDLGTVPNMFAMVPLAQSAHSPISDLTKDDGIRGSQISQHTRYVEQLVT